MKSFALVIVALCLSLSAALAQQPEEAKPAEPNHEFSISFELRPRAEFRYGYATLRRPDSKPAFFVSQRTRLNFFYRYKMLTTYVSIQDVRVWGDRTTQDSKASLGLFETWAQINLVKGLSLKIGRQKIMYDNQRLFAEADWNQGGRAHDALFLKYQNEKTQADIGIAYSQLAETNFGTEYTPSLINHYKFLGVFWFWRMMGDFKLSLLSATDGFQKGDSITGLNVRTTNGGRIEYEKKKLYVTFSGYLQSGRSPAGQTILAYYFQPEVKLTLNKLTLRLGLEYLSGNDFTDTENVKLNCFVPLYGVAHRFMGYMDYFIRFPNDVKGAGLNNPYLGAVYKFSDKVALRSEFQAFFLQNNLLAAGEEVPKYLGFEHDLRLNYKIIKDVALEVGYCYLLADESMEAVKGGDSGLFQQWGYVMFTVNPTIFTFRK